jgi:hypothetical protein
MRKDLLKKIIVGCFVLVPLLSSIISTVHLVDFFYLGNPGWISYTVAFAIEIGSVASFLTLSILSKLNKNIVWGMFFILFIMQVIGNIYFTYDWVSMKILENPTWLSNFREMSEFFFDDVELKTTKMILSLLIGVPIPLISVFLLKSTADYLGTDIEETKEEVKKNEVGETIKEPVETTEKNDEDAQIHIQSNTKGDRNRLHPSRY